jgi:hypothetical protein
MSKRASSHPPVTSDNRVRNKTDTPAVETQNPVNKKEKGKAKDGKPPTAKKKNPVSGLNVAKAIAASLQQEKINAYTCAE